MQYSIAIFHIKILNNIILAKILAILLMENGNVIECILADCKADKDTDITDHQTEDGSIVEFVVDSSKLYKMAKKMGDISYCDEKLKGEILKIRVYEE